MPSEETNSVTPEPQDLTLTPDGVPAVEPVETVETVVNSGFTVDATTVPEPVKEVAPAVPPTQVNQFQVIDEKPPVEGIDSVAYQDNMRAAKTVEYRTDAT